MKKHHSKKGSRMINPPYDEYEAMEKPAGHRVKPHMSHTDDKPGKISNPGNTTKSGKMGINSIMLELDNMSKKHKKEHMRLRKKYAKK